MLPKPPPPFTALRAIEAAVRHRSYTWAAKELAITHSAVSQAIKRLESQLGTKLFERRGAAMEPSAAALQLARAYSDAAGVLQRSLSEITDTAVPSHLTVTMPADFARLWFAPRLASLATTIPELSVEVRTQQNATADDDSDLAISLGCTERPDWRAEPLFDITLLPLCSPAFAERYDVRTPEDALRVPLLSEPGLPWRIWLSGAGLHAASAQRGHIFDDGAMVLDSAARDHGLALSQTAIAEDYIRSGALIAPIELEIAADQQMFIGWRERVGEPDLAVRLVDWVKAELRTSRTWPIRPRGVMRQRTAAP